MSTARDIARVAGVSTSTVSHVLNETRWVSPELRERVLAVAKSLQYEPDAVARSLRMKRSNTIALVISDIGNPFFTSVVRGVEDVARHHGYAVILCNSDEDPEKEAEYLRLLPARRVDGLILVPSGIAHEQLVRLVHKGFPLVFLDREVQDVEVPTVVLDNVTAAREAVEYLLGLGHTRIGMVTGRPMITTTNDRVQGYKSALTAAGMTYDPSLLKTGDSQIAGGRQAAEALVALDSPPTAILVGNNQMTIGVVAAIQDLGMRIPEEVSLVGFDDSPWAEVCRPRLTTVAQPTYEMGRTAADLTLGRIADDGSVAVGRVVLPGQLIIRESAGTPAATGAKP